MKERALVKQILFWLSEQRDCWTLKVVGGPLQRHGVPDILGCCLGEFFGLEVKAPGAPGPTAIQNYEIRQIALAGGTATVVRSTDEVKALISLIRERKARAKK